MITTSSRWAAGLVLILGVTTLSGCVGATRPPTLARSNRSETCVEPLKKSAARSRHKTTESPAVVEANVPREIDKFR